MSNFDKTHTKKSASSADTPLRDSDLWDLDDDYKAAASKAPSLEVIEATVKAADAKDNMEADDYAPIEKSNVSTIEKLALICLAMMLLCFAVLGYIWLHKQNELGKITYTIDLPAKGTYATLTEYSSYWKSKDDFPELTTKAFYVPVVNITLGKNSTSGALRCYFYDHTKAIVGDPISLTFKNGLFDNGKNTLEIASTHGLTFKNDLLAYQMEPSLNWNVVIQEGENQSMQSSEFKVLVNSNVSKDRKASGE